MKNNNLTDRATLILDKEDVDRKILRMAYEIYEEYEETEELTLIGIKERGTVLAKILKSKLESISEIKITFLEIDIDKLHPLNAQLTQKFDCDGKNLILVDDVANSGRTLFYSMRPFQNCLPNKIQTAVLIDRMHKSFPISVDYTGYRLSTTLQEKVIVDIDGDEINGAFLDEWVLSNNENGVRTNGIADIPLGILKE